MPSFSYTAKNSSGETKAGIIETKDKIEVARTLRRQGLVPITVKLLTSQGKPQVQKGIFDVILKFDLAVVLSFVKGVPLADKMMFSRHLAVMISAGVPITKALKVLGKQTRHPKFKSAIEKISEDINKGTSFSEALSNHPKIFNRLYASMVKSGETAGNMSEVLELLADQLKKEHELRARIRGAMMYPSVVVVAMALIGVLMMIMVVPKLSEIFADLGAQLPLTTRIIIKTSEILTRYWIFLLIGAGPAIYGVRRALATKSGERIISWIFLKIPAIKGIVQKINSARFARTLSSLIGGGVPILEGIKITKDTLGNYYYRKSMDSVYEEVKSVKSLFESIAKFEKIYPGLIVQMIEVGEETGELGNILERLAEFYEEEVNNATKNLSSIIEPILMLVIGAAVGFFAVSMIQPMYSLMGSI